MTFLLKVGTIRLGSIQCLTCGINKEILTAMKQSMAICLVFAALAVFLQTAARADLLFEIDPNPGGTKMFIDSANKNVSSFQGFLGNDGAGPGVPVIDITTVGNVDTGSGFSNIKPVKNGTLSSLTFTPQDSTLFDDFSFRGQLLTAAGGNVHLTVVAKGGTTESFDFTGLGAHANFARVGIHDALGSTATIFSVTISSGSFKAVKQIEFSVDPISAPEPSTFIIAALGAFGFLGYSLRSRLKK